MDNNEYFGYDELSTNIINTEVKEQIIQTPTLEILNVINVDNICGNNYLVIEAVDRENQKNYDFIDYNAYDNYIKYNNADYGVFELLVQTTRAENGSEQRNFVQVIDFKEIEVNYTGAELHLEESMYDDYLEYCENELDKLKDDLYTMEEEIEFSQNLTLNKFNEKLYEISKNFEIKKLNKDLAAIKYMDDEFIRFNLNRPRKFNIHYDTSAIHLDTNTLVLIMKIFNQYLRTPLTYRENDKSIKNLKNKVEKYKLESVNINKNQLNRFFAYNIKDKAISLEDFYYANNNNNFIAQFTDTEINKYINSNGISSKQYKKIKVN